MPATSRTSDARHESASVPMDKPPVSLYGITPPAASSEQLEAQQDDNPTTKPISPLISLTKALWIFLGTFAFILCAWPTGILSMKSNPPFSGVVLMTLVSTGFAYIVMRGRSPENYTTPYGRVLDYAFHTSAQFLGPWIALRVLRLCGAKDG